MISSDNNRIAKNTLLLFIRMLFVLIINLYTSRVILQSLGVTDYGVYNVVAGFVSMFGFLNATLSSSTLQYNILENVKRYESFDTISGAVSGAFRDVTPASAELTVTEKIWDFVKGVLQTIAETFNFDQDEMMCDTINNNDKELAALQKDANALQLAA